MLPLLVMPQPANGAAATAACTSTNADGASKGSDDAATAGGGPAAVAAELPLHLTEKLLCHMSLLESARLATVCKSWASTVAALLAAPPPQLYVCTPPDINSDRRGLVASVTLDGGALSPTTPAAATTMPSRVRSADVNGLRCIGATPSGRVAFAAGWFSDQVVLVNPLTGARRSVHVGTSRLDHGRVLAGDALFAVDCCTRMLWRPKQAAPCGGAGGEEEEWSACAVEPTLHQQQPPNPIFSAVNCNGRFYLLHNDGSLSVVDATAAPPLRTEKLPVPRVTGGGLYVSGHLLESDGEVLFVQQLVACDEEDESVSVCGFEVHRLDLKEQQWTKVKELTGDRALFVSPGSSFAVRASETPGCRRNCIYFVGKKQYYSDHACHQNFGSSWGVYSMEERRVLFEYAVTGPGRGSEAVWFLPRVVMGGF